MGGPSIVSGPVIQHPPRRRIRPFFPGESQDIGRRTQVSFPVDLLGLEGFWYVGDRGKRPEKNGDCPMVSLRDKKELQ